jgi:hypothetical protein
MFRCVARGGEHPEPPAAQVDLVAVAQRLMWPRDLAARGSGDLGAAGGELSAAGHEVGVQMGLGRQGDVCIESLCGDLVGGRVPLGIDHHRIATDGQHPGGVAQPFVGHRQDRYVVPDGLDRHRHVFGHHRVLHSAPTATGSPARRHSGNPSCSRCARRLWVVRARTASSANTQNRPRQ